MKFFTIAKVGKEKRKRSALLVSKVCKYGDVISTESVRHNAKTIVFSGPHNSGKTRYMTKLAEEAEPFWINQYKPVKYSTYSRWGEDKDRILDGRELVIDESEWTFPKPLFINARGAKGEWQHEILPWWKKRNPKEKWSKLSPFEKDRVLVTYLKETHAILFIDDVHLLSNSSNKTRLVKEMITVASRVVISCAEETQICQSLRSLLVTPDERTQILRLKSDDAADDVTQSFVWLLITILLAAAGQLGLASLVGGVGLLKSRGNSRAAR